MEEATNGPETVGTSKLGDSEAFRASTGAKANVDTMRCLMSRTDTDTWPVRQHGMEESEEEEEEEEEEDDDDEPR